MNVISRGIRNAFRNVTRTVSIVVILAISVGLALSMQVARTAVGDKIASVKSSVGTTVTVSPAGVRGFEGGGNALTVDEIAKVKALAHVTSVDESLNDRLSSDNTSLISAIDLGSLGQRFARNNGGSSTQMMSPGGGQRTFTPPVTVIGTTSPTNISNTQGGGTFSLKDGKVFTASSTDNVAVIGTSLATKNNLKVGSTFTVYNTTITVIGIFDAGNTFSNTQVIMPLGTVQKLSSQVGAITGATLNVDSVANTSAVTAAAKTALGSTADVTNAEDRAQQVLSPLENIQTITLYSLIGAIMAGAVIILLTMIMIVRERRREIGILKAIGGSNVTVVSQFIVEATTLTVLGAIVGLAVGALLASPITSALVSSSTTTTGQAVAGMGRGFGRLLGRGLDVGSVTATVGWSTLGYGLLIAIFIAIIGSSVAALLIAKVRPGEVMRAE